MPDAAACREADLRAALADVLGDAIHAPECGPYSNAPCVCLIGRLKAVLAGSLTGAGCTGLTADWCPVHGTCRCRLSRHRCDIECPLHSPDSQHPIPSPEDAAPAPIAPPGPTVPSSRTLSADEVRALATVETAERLARFALRLLDGPDPMVPAARNVLAFLTDETSSRSATAVKDQALSDQIAHHARSVVRQVRAQLHPKEASRA